MSYEQKIIEAIAAAPNLRAVQISDKIDLDLDVVEQILLRLVATHVLTTRIGDAPNGRKVTEYRIAQGAAYANGKARLPAGPMPAPLSSATPKPGPVAEKSTQAPVVKKTAAAESKPRRQYKRKQQDASSTSAIQFRCALWSDGILEIRRGSDDIVLLTQDEQRAILRALASTNLMTAPGCAGG